MTGLELKQALSEYSYPLPATKRQGIFALYAAVTGKPKERQCPNCATDAYFELRIIARDYDEKEIPLIHKSSVMTTNKVKPISLVKYRILQPFRPFGEPKVYDNTNTTDEQVEALLKSNNALRGHFERVDGLPVLTFLNPAESKPEVKHSITVQSDASPVKIRRTSKRTKKK